MIDFQQVNTSYNQLHILGLFDVLPNFLLPQVKRWVIITYKHGIYELPYELQNDLRLRRLGNIRKFLISETSLNDSLVPSPPPE